MRILLLDHEVFYIPEEFRSKVERPFHGRFYEVNGMLSKIVCLLGEPFDIVILGNNMGAGVTIAQNIPEALRSKTIVVWNYYPIPRDVKEYEKLGLSHFCGRQSPQVRGKIQAILSS